MASKSGELQQKLLLPSDLTCDAAEDFASILVRDVSDK